MSIVINTPNGNIGRTLAHILLDVGEPVTVISRGADKAAELVGRGARLVQGSIDDPRVLAEAFTEARALFWLTPPTGRPDFVPWGHQCAREAAAAAKAAGVQQAVVLSSVGAQHGHGTGPVNVLRGVEEAFAAALPSTVNLRAGFFMENLLRDLSTIAATGSMFAAVPPGASFSMVATRDIAARAAAHLLSPRQSGAYTTGAHGPKDMTYGEVAAILSDVLARPVAFVPITVEQARHGMQSAGMPDFMANAYAEMYEGVNRGLMAAAEPRTAETTTPTTLRSFAREVLRPALERFALRTA